MKTTAAVVAVILAQAFVVPAIAQTAPAPTTKAECEKNKDLKWDDKANGGKGACVKK